MLNVCVIFGGTGFIGGHFARHLIERGLVGHVILADIAPPRRNSFISEAVSYVHVDVRTSSQTWKLPASVDLIANFAAVHREPGHENFEYFETNVSGAENVCTFAQGVGCQRIIFTSSIAVYGLAEALKTEIFIPKPSSAYGTSKLEAEKIHLDWLNAEAGRKLVVVRPGVVFGQGEEGNVTRLVRATVRHYFVYTGNRHTRKAGGYVKELVNSMWWVLLQIPDPGGVVLYNFTMAPTPTLSEYVSTIGKVANTFRWIPSVPYRLLLGVSYVIDPLAKLLGIRQPINPVRIRKLVSSNNIDAAVLRQEGYQYQYTLESAMQDWRNESPKEWL